MTATSGILSAASRWSITGRRVGEIPAETELSRSLSKDLSKRGFKFVGSTIVYSFMQACGLVNDHIVECFRFSEIEHFTASCSNELLET